MWILNSEPMQRRFSDTSNCRKCSFSESLDFIQLRHLQKNCYKNKKNFATHELDYPHATAFFTLLAL